MEFCARSKNSYCFKKDNISSSNQPLAGIDADDPFSGRVQQLARDRSLWSVRRPSSKSYLKLDSIVTTSSTVISDADILFDTSNDVGNDANNDKVKCDNDTDETPPLCLSNFEAE